MTYQPPHLPDGAPWWATLLLSGVAIFVWPAISKVLDLVGAKAQRVDAREASASKVLADFLREKDVLLTEYRKDRDAAKEQLDAATKALAAARSQQTVDVVKMQAMDDRLDGLMRRCEATEREAERARQRADECERREAALRGEIEEVREDLRSIRAECPASRKG